MERKQFKTFEEYQSFIQELPDGTDFDENAGAVENGDFSYLIVTLPSKTIRIARPPSPTGKMSLRTDNSIHYQCICGEIDVVEISATTGIGKRRGCCDHTAKVTVTIEEIGKVDEPDF